MTCDTWHVTPDNLHVTPHEKSVNICLVSYVLVLLSAHVQRLKLEKSRFYGFCRTKYFSDSPPNLFFFPQKFLLNFIKVYRSLPNLQVLQKKFETLKFSKCAIHKVLLQFQIVLIYTLFPPNLYPQKVRVDKLNCFFPTQLRANFFGTSGWIWKVDIPSFLFMAAKTSMR